MIEPKRLVRNVQIPRAVTSHQLRRHPEPIKLAHDTVWVLRRNVINDVNPRPKLRSEAWQSRSERLNGIGQRVEPRRRVAISVTLGGIEHPSVVDMLLPTAALTLPLRLVLANASRLNTESRRDGRRTLGVAWNQKADM